MQIQKNVNPVVQMEKRVKKNFERRDIEKEARETYRVESWRYWEKLRGEREWESETARPILPLPTPPPRKTEDPSHCPRRHPHETHLAALTQTQTPHQCCHRRPILQLVDQSAQPNFIALAFTVHISHSIKYLIYPSKPNIMFVNLRICTSGVCVFTDEWWWWLLIWIYASVLVVFFFFFFFFLAFWLCESVCLLGSWAIIGTRDKKRNNNSIGLKMVKLEKVFIGNE